MSALAGVLPGAADLRRPGAPGAALRLLAGGAAGTLLFAVVSGATGDRAAHRLLAALALPPLLALLLAAAVAHRRLLAPTTVTIVAFLAAATVTARTPHIALAALSFAAALALVPATFRGEPVARGAWRDYLTLTKPRIMSLLLITGAAGTVVGAGGWPGTARFAETMVGLALACGGASALNHVIDRDIDKLMGKRTAGRPVAAGRLTAARGLEFGLTLSAASFVLLASTVNLLTAALALAGNLFYVLVYTGFLKRRGPQNIVIGGAAGAVPPLVGCAAGGGHLGLSALWLFGIVFLWTPPHFWALALLLRDHYAAADVPMLPVVRGERSTVRQIVVYTLALVAFTAAPVLTGTFGWTYLAGALVLGGVFVALAARLGDGTDRRRAAVCFHWSLLYLALLFAVAAIDAAI
ncbi:MAG TPA: heme o synthase [Gaiellaceae bacterium]